MCSANVASQRVGMAGIARDRKRRAKACLLGSFCLRSVSKAVLLAELRSNGDPVLPPQYLADLVS